jgi:hypothetical protein
MPRHQGRDFYVANSMAGMMPTEPAEVVAYPRKKAELMKKSIQLRRSELGPSFQRTSVVD